MTNTSWNTDDTITIDTSVIGDITLDASAITVDLSDRSSVSSTIDTITITNGNSTYYNNDNSTVWADNIKWEQTEFEDKMPSIDKVHNMCGHYPALEKAYENFKTIYKLVHQDYVGNHQENDETPF